MKQEILENFKLSLHDCTKCKLHSTRSSLVFGEGSSDSKFMFIGEGPGVEEDLQGRPFVGRSGKLLTKIIQSELGLQREDVYIANLVKCRPTRNLEGKKDRPPEEDELQACTPFLEEQIRIIQPKVIITLGSPAMKFLIKTNNNISSIHGCKFCYNNIPVYPIYHPSYLLRTGEYLSPYMPSVIRALRKIKESV